jgi:hypothetical protein
MKIHVTKPFYLNMGGSLKPFRYGVHEVTEEEANHWYTKLHAEVVKEEVREPEKKKKHK